MVRWKIIFGLVLVLAAAGAGVFWLDGYALWPSTMNGAAELGHFAPAAGPSSTADGGAANDETARDTSMQIIVTNVDELAGAVQTARPGTTIILAPGDYHISRRIFLGVPGTSASPIVMRAESLGDAHLYIDTQEGVVVHAPNWTVENLDMRGVCQNDSWCEHAFHVVGPASNLILRHNRLRDFNAAIKGNGLDGVFPSNVLIDHNYLYNTHPRDTGNPVALIDVVGGHHWVVRNNFIGDFGRKDEGINFNGNVASYGAFLKGNSRDGVFENNLVICDIRSHESIRIGLSFGGGGTGREYCENKDCSTEHTNGIMRNNIIMRCSNDVGIYLNRSKNTKIYNNTLYDNFGIEARYPTSTADIQNNIISGGISMRDGAVVTAQNNLVAGFSTSPLVPGIERWVQSKVEGINRKYPNFIKIDPYWVKALLDDFSDTRVARATILMRHWFTAPDTANFAPASNSPVLAKGAIVPDVESDFCGKPRSNPPSLGAIEYDSGTCDVRAWVNAGVAE